LNNQGSPKKLLSLADETIAYGSKVVLDEINLHLHDGERIVLLGKSGSGKSTLLKHLHQTLVNNDETIAWIPQRLGLTEKLSVFHNVFIGRLDQQSRFTNLRNLLWPAQEHRQAIHEILQELSLAEELFSPVGTLSGGQQQRVAAARALYRQASILLADEPATGLDQGSAKTLMTLIEKNFGSCVIALHDVDLAMSIADRIIGLRDGKIILDALAADLSPEALAPIYHDANTAP